MALSMGDYENWTIGRRPGPPTTAAAAAAVDAYAEEQVVLHWNIALSSAVLAAMGMDNVRHVNFECARVCARACMDACVRGHTWRACVCTCVLTCVLTCVRARTHECTHPITTHARTRHTTHARHASISSTHARTHTRARPCTHVHVCRFVRGCVGARFMLIIACERSSRLRVYERLCMTACTRGILCACVCVCACVRAFMLYYCLSGRVCECANVRARVTPAMHAGVCVCVRACVGGASVRVVRACVYV
jgi:hypothetical protein